MLPASRAPEAWLCPVLGQLGRCDHTAACRSRWLLNIHAVVDCYRVLSLSCRQGSLHAVCGVSLIAT